MLKVESVVPGSRAETLGIRPGDQISRINGEPVRDLLNYHFCIAVEDKSISLRTTICNVLH